MVEHEEMIVRGRLRSPNARYASSASVVEGCRLTSLLLWNLDSRMTSPCGVTSVNRKATASHRLIPVEAIRPSM